MKRKALGRGLSALLSDVPVQEGVEQDKSIIEITPEHISANQWQPRSSFDEEELQDLARSIQTHGVLQPLLVRADEQQPGKFQLIAGERRLRASKIAQRKTVPCILIETEEAEMLEIALVENIQRSNLSVVEEAKAYKHLIERFNLRQEEVAQRVGKSRESITNILRLLNLPRMILGFLEEGKLSAGHARALLGLKLPSEMEDIANQIIEKQLSVRETESLVRDESQANKPGTEQKPKEPQEDDLYLQDLEQVLASKFQTKIKIKMNRRKKGKIEFEFYDLDHLQSLLDEWNVSVG